MRAKYVHTIIYIYICYSCCCGCKWLLSMAPANGYISIDFKIMKANTESEGNNLYLYFRFSFNSLCCFCILAAVDKCCWLLSSIGACRHCWLPHDTQTDGQTQKVTSISGGITILGLHVAGGWTAPTSTPPSRTACLRGWLPYLHIGVDVCCLDCFN